VMLLANALAIPWVSFVLVPLCLLSCLVSVLSVTLGQGEG